MENIWRSFLQRFPGTIGIRDGHAFALGKIAAADLPTCNATRQFEKRVIPGAAGVADRQVVCDKSTADTYAWRDEGPAALGTTYQPLDSDLTVIAGLADPNADRILFWDDSAGAYAHLAPDSSVTISTTTLSSTPSLDNLTDVAITSVAEGDRLVRDASQWVNLPLGTLRKGRVTEYVEDFMGGTAVTGNIGDNNWSFAATGSGAISGPSVLGFFQPGFYLLQTGATISSTIMTHNPGLAIILDVIDEAEFIFYIDTPITTVQFMCGLTDTTALTSRVVGVIFDTTSATTTWHTYKDTVAGAVVIGTLGVTVTATTLYHFLFKRTGTGAFDITVTSGGGANTATANVSGLESANYFPFFRVVDLAAANRVMYVDYCRVVTEAIARV